MNKFLIIFLFFFTLFLTENRAQILIKNDLEKSVNYLVDFINSSYFEQLKEENSDLDLIDTLYLRSLRMNNFNYSETLLSLTFATLPFRVMPLHIPYTGIKFDVKLPSGDPNYLEEKISNLPKQIFPDSPKSKFGDKDKVAHFFGNAYFAYSVSIFNISKFLSMFVELFEDAFKVEGAIDKRDFIANKLGYYFGKALKSNPRLMPSKILSDYSKIKL